jgi:hypothetical protein
MGGIVKVKGRLSIKKGWPHHSAGETVAAVLTTPVRTSRMEERNLDGYSSPHLIFYQKKESRNRVVVLSWSISLAGTYKTLWIVDLMKTVWAFGCGLFGLVSGILGGQCGCKYLASVFSVLGRACLRLWFRRCLFVNLGSARARMSRCRRGLRQPPLSKEGP